MGYYDFPHTRNYDTDLGYIIDKTKENTTNIATLDEEIKRIDITGLKEDVANLQTDNTKNKSNISTLQNDNTTNKTNIATNSTNITKLQSDVDLNSINISANKIDIKELQNADYLKLVGFINSENVTVTDHGKVDGKQTFTIAVTGTTPVNLTSNVDFFNNNPQQPVISLAAIELDASTNVIKLSIYNYKNGEMDSTESSIKLSTDEFKVVDDTLTLNKTYVTSTTLEQELEELTTTFNRAIATKQDKLTGGVKNNLLYKKSDTEGDVGWTSITTDNLLTQDNIVNNLTSSSTTNALGAGQGKLLKDSLDATNKVVNNLSPTQRNDIEVSVTPTALSSYCSWDTEQKYGYSATITVSGITTNSLIQNIVMTDTLLSAIANVVTTTTNGLIFYTTDATALSGTIYTLVTMEV